MNENGNEKCSLLLFVARFGFWCEFPRGCNAIYVPYGDVLPIRVYFLAFESKTGCLFSSLSPKQGAKFVLSLLARVRTHSTVWHCLVLTYLSFFSETSCCV